MSYFQMGHAINIFNVINPQIEKLQSEGLTDYADGLVTALCGSTGSEILLGVYRCLKNMPVELSEERRDELMAIKNQLKKILNDSDWNVE